MTFSLGQESAMDFVLILATSYKIGEKKLCCVNDAECVTDKHDQY